MDKTLNMVEFFYPEEIAAFERDFVEARRAPMDKFPLLLA